MQTFPKSEIVDIRHGTEVISWGGASIGRAFRIDIKCANNSTLSVVFNSYLSLKPEYTRMYFKILRNLWDYYFATWPNRNARAFSPAKHLYSAR